MQNKVYLFNRISNFRTLSQTTVAVLHFHSISTFFNQKKIKFKCIKQKLCYYIDK